MTIHHPSSEPTTSGAPTLNEGVPPTLSPGPAVPRPSTVAWIPLDAIVERTNSTLDLRPERIEHLIISIGAVGLKQPLVLLANNLLVNGRHRLHALRLLRDRDPGDFLAHFPDGLIPVERVELGGQSEANAISALQVAEAPGHTAYTKAELVRAVEYLAIKGYVKKRGRPGKGELRMGPTLRDAFGQTRTGIARAFGLASNPERLLGKAAPPRRLAAAKKAVAKISREDLPELVAWIEALRHQEAA